MRILVAMSGGVDSSVVARLLHEQGHEVIGVMMMLWQDPLAPAVRLKLPKKCCSLEHIERARGLCAKLGVPFYVKNFEDDFKQTVIDPFLEKYSQGLNPNPCIACNRSLKFGGLLKIMAELGCEKLATGHYARTVVKTDGFNSYSALLEAKDKHKDQSYYLYGLSGESLSKILFPLGEMEKSEVFALAKSMHVPLSEHYRESQDLCFFPERTPQAFLRRHIPNAIEPGPIETLEGKTVGSHEGLPLYTVGQRRGLKIGGLKIPLYVVKKDTATNTLFVAPQGLETKKEAKLTGLHWLSHAPRTGTALHARIHSLGVKHPGELRYKADSGTFVFHTALPGVTPGQHLVLYEGEEVLGGAEIAA